MESVSILGFSLVAIIVNFFIYVVASILLNMFYKKRYDKSSALAFIPILQFYIIGKLLKGKKLGITFVVLGIITINSRVTLFLGDKNVIIPFGRIFWIIILILILILFIKYIKQRKHQ